MTRLPLEKSRSKCTTAFTLFSVREYPSVRQDDSVELCGERKRERQEDKNTAGKNTTSRMS